MIETRKDNRITVEEGQFSAEARREDPYGFWRVFGRMGKTKWEAQSQFTSATEARKEIERQFEKLTKTNKEAQPVA